MSAFLCSNEHIRTLALYDANTVEKANEIAQKLFEMNVQAMDTRYPGRWRDDYEGGEPPPPAPITGQEFLLRQGPPPTPIQIIKLCQCYDYQACEATDYETSKAEAMIHTIQYTAISRLPGYEESPWSI